MINLVPLVTDLADAVAAESRATHRREAAERELVDAIDTMIPSECAVARRIIRAFIKLTIAHLLRRPRSPHGPGRVTVEFHVGPITEQ